MYFSVLNSVDYYKGGAKSDRLPVTPSKFDLDSVLQSLSPHLQFLRLNPTSLIDSKASRAFRERIHENLLQANEQWIRQYGNQRGVKELKVGESVSVVVPALDSLTATNEI